MCNQICLKSLECPSVVITKIAILFGVFFANHGKKAGDFQEFVWRLLEVDQSL